MEVAVWILAIVGIIRILQNSIQLIMMFRNSAKPNFDRATDAFIESLKKTDEEFIDNMIKKQKEKNNDT